jgi:hypothetical protein
MVAVPVSPVVADRADRQLAHDGIGDLESRQEAGYCRGIRSGTSGLEANPGVDVIIVVLVSLSIQGRSEDTEKNEESG